GEADRGLLRGRAHAEEFADVPAVVEGLGELGYAVEGVAAFQQGGDGAQAGQMVVVVPGDAALAAGRRDQLAFAVEPQGAHRDAGQPGQLLHAVLAPLTGFRAVFCHISSLGPDSLAPPARDAARTTGGNFLSPPPTHQYGAALRSRLRQCSLAGF